ncbi:glycosyltransferase involved in cell wall biosynthesis [Agromyces sp. 3263]|uniref:glycosyltransferase family 2 protein n=1 Tax=Agromyces sp. 3263 TaxID=2817750 RepID=UPI00285DE89D|nr:glycosyltransferase family 2 protein [Agromyces sp. 3263]MDR6905632.1 glycosyltransferase involved in cell wall biosynthesis [Agromyces sp. 3263]
MRVRFPAPTDARPAVTVVIPCYRQGQYLDAAVGAVLAQDDVDPRVVIVDDASPDGSLAAGRRLAADERVQVIAHDEHAGRIASCNDGLAVVTTEFVAVVSADDLVAPGALGRAARLMLAEPTVGMVYGRPLELDDESDAAGVGAGARRVTWTVWHGHEWIRLACWRGRSFILSPEVVVRMEAVRQVGPYDARLPHSDELEFPLRMAARWDVARVNGPLQAMHRVHADDTRVSAFDGMAEHLRERAAAFRTIAAPGTREAVPRYDLLLSRAERAVAREALLLAQRELDGGGDADVASDLYRVAGEVRRSSLRRRRGRAVVRGLRRAYAGGSPRLAQRCIEACRRQLDRLRWSFWRHVGIS